MSDLSEKWELIKEAVRNDLELTDISYDTWIKPLKLGEVTDDTVIIVIQSEQGNYIKYIESKYKTFFQVTISEMMNHTYEVIFKLEKDIDENNIIPDVNKNIYNINYENANLNPKYKFENFVVGNNNKMAHAAAVAVAESPGTAYNPLFIYGGAGLGKTHLMHAIGHFILQQNPNTKVLYVTSEDFTNEVVNAIRENNSNQHIKKIHEKYRTVDVLMVDDVQFIIGKDATQEEFFHTFNALHSSGKQIIISSDKPPKQMDILDERFRSRFEWGLLADIQSPDYETRVAILMKYSENQDQTFNKEIIEYIAENIKSNIRELEGAVNKILAYAKLNKEPITLQLAEEALRDVIDPKKPVKATASYIISVVAEHFEVRSEDISSSKRSADIALARQVAMYLCREYTDNSLKEIGKLLGKKDHTTIIHGCKNIKEMIETDEELKSKIETIKSKIDIN